MTRPISIQPSTSSPLPAGSDVHSVPFGIQPPGGAAP